jgi:Sec-independent protein translocase protein TatA
MSRTEFVIAIAVILFGAFLLGWVLSSLVGRFTRGRKGDMAELDRMAHALHEAEEQRDEAVDWARKREAQLTHKLTQSEAELAAAMEGLRDARAEVGELRDYIDRQRA